jgi:predicted alpha/beta-hydrolase family hydrolase
VADVGAVGVLCLAFPFIPPGKGPEKSREDELDGVSVPLLIVQGSSDQFGMPPSAPGREVAVVAGNHGLKKDLGAVGDAVRAWLPGVL